MSAVTPQLRALLAERAKGKSEEKREQERINRRWDRIGAATIALIDRAAPFMDEGAAPDRWPPSALLKIAYFTCATAEDREAERRGALFVLDMLDRARRLWVGGFRPNPFLPDSQLVKRDA